MHNLKKVFIAITLPLVFIACGGGDTTSNTNTNTTPQLNDSEPSIDSRTPISTSTPLTENRLVPSSLKISIDNTGKQIKKSFNGYDIQISSDKELSTQYEISHETVAIYGKINNNLTKALLKINDNYRNSNITIEVYKNGNLLAQKENLSLTNQVALNFGNIITNE